MSLGLGMGLGMGMNVAAAGGGGGGGSGMTWNPSDKDAGIVLSSGNLVAAASAGGGFSSVRATAGKSSGKWYFEVLIQAVPNNTGVGVGNLSADLANFMASTTTTARGWYSSGFGGGGATFANGDVIGVAVDVGTEFVWFAKNNVWLASSDPATATGGNNTPGITNYYPMFGGGDGTGLAHFTAASLTYSPPSGFTAIG